MKNILLTGGTGFFGKSILDYCAQRRCDRHFTLLSRHGLNRTFALSLRNEGYEFDEIHGDVRSFDVGGRHFDAIIHAAAALNPALSDEEIISSTVDGTRHVIDMAKSISCKTILYTSSGAVYGKRMKSVDENDACNPDTPYGMAKVAAEHILLDSGLDVKIARCFAFVGRHLDRGIYYAIGNFIQNCLDNEPIVIKGDGTPLRSYLYADDLVEWLFAILDRGEPGRPYNVGSPKGLSISELAETVRSALDTQNDIIIQGAPSPKPCASRPPPTYVPITSRAESELGLRVTVPLAEAIRLSATQSKLVYDKA